MPFTSLLDFLLFQCFFFWYDAWILGASSFLSVTFVFTIYWGCLTFLVLFISIVITYQKRSFWLAFILLLKMHDLINWESSCIFFFSINFLYRINWELLFHMLVKFTIEKNGGNGFWLAIAELDSLLFIW